MLCCGFDIIWALRADGPALEWTRMLNTQRLLCRETIDWFAECWYTISFACLYCSIAPTFCVMQLPSPCFKTKPAWAGTKYVALHRSPAKAQPHRRRAKMCATMPVPAFRLSLNRLQANAKRHLPAPSTSQTQVLDGSCSPDKVTNPGLSGVSLPCMCPRKLPPIPPPLAPPSSFLPPRS